MDQNKFSKFAQRRSVLNKLREKTNISGQAAEKFFNPEFQEVMESLRESDDQIWSIVKGESGEDSSSLKDLIKAARSNFNRREFITAVNFLGRFHKKMDEIVNVIKKLNFDVDKVHHEFLFKDLDSEQEKHLEALRGRFAQKIYAFQKEAGIMDFLSNLTTTRGRALSAWEKRYPNRVKNFKKDAGSLLTASEKMLKIVEDRLHEMGKFRAQRKVDNFMDSAKKIISAFGSYDGSFKELYGANIKSFVNDFLDQKKEKARKAEEMKQNSEEQTSENLPEEWVDMSGIENEESTLPVASERATIPDLEPEIKNKDLNPVPTASEAALDPQAAKIYEQIKDPNKNEALKPAKTPNVEKLDLDLGELEKDQINEPRDTQKPKEAHQKFVSFLETLGSEDPRFLEGKIRLYAKKIEAEDPEASIQLLQIAKKIGR